MLPKYVRVSVQLPGLRWFVFPSVYFMAQHTAEQQNWGRLCLESTSVLEQNTPTSQPDILILFFLPSPPLPPPPSLTHTQRCIYSHTEQEKEISFLFETNFAMKITGFWHIWKYVSLCNDQCWADQLSVQRVKSFNLWFSHSQTPSNVLTLISVKLYRLYEHWLSITSS